MFDRITVEPGESIVTTACGEVSGGRALELIGGGPGAASGGPACRMDATVARIHHIDRAPDGRELNVRARCAPKAARPLAVDADPSPDDPDGIAGLGDLDAVEKKHGACAEITDRKPTVNPVPPGPPRVAEEHLVDEWATASSHVITRNYRHRGRHDVADLAHADAFLIPILMRTPLGTPGKGSCVVVAIISVLGISRMAATITFSL